jgi:hypothetical protein
MALTIKKVIVAASIALTSFNAQALTRIEIDDFGDFNGTRPWGVTQTTIYTDYINVQQGSLDTLFMGRITPNYTQVLNITFSTDMLGSPLTVGTYEDAERSAFASPGHPGLDLGRDGSGFNTLNGRFEVFEITRAPNGSFLSFAASFEIFDFAPIGHPSVAGRVWYNSDYGIGAVPEPESVAMLFAGLGLISLFAGNKKQ